MEQKNSKYENIGHSLIRSAGCIPVTLITSGMLVLFGWIFFNLYFFGSAAAWVKPFQDSTYLVGLALIGLTTFVIWKAAWRNFTFVYRSFARYLNMRQEKSRLKRLIAQSKAEPNAEIHNLEYFEEAEKYKQSR